MENVTIERFTVMDNPVELAPDEVDAGESLLKEARLFYVGVHKGRDYTVADLERIVENFDPDQAVPIQLDHSSSARDTVGFVRKLWLEDDGLELHGEMEFLGRENVERVRLGLWKRVSVSLEIKRPDMKLIEVSITPFPALSNAEMFSKIDVEGNELIESEPLKSSDDSDDHNVENVSRVEFDRLKEDIETLRATRFSLEKALMENQAERIVENHIQKGITTPAMGPEELKLILSMDSNQQRQFFAYKATQPPFYYLETMCGSKAEKPGEEQARKARAEAEEILRFTSWRED